MPPEERLRGEQGREREGGDQDELIPCLGTPPVASPESPLSTGPRRSGKVGIRADAPACALILLGRYSSNANGAPRFSHVDGGDRNGTATVLEEGLNRS